MNEAKYYCYWNIHKKCFSVKYRGKVIKHLHKFYGIGCQFKVSEVGRARVLKEKKKSVHAYIACDMINQLLLNFEDGDPVRYNPYEGPHFMCNGQPVFNALAVSFSVENNKPVVKIRH